MPDIDEDNQIIDALEKDANHLKEEYTASAFCRAESKRQDR